MAVHDEQVSVLVAEDDPAVRRSLERALGFEGYRVVVASDGAEALDRIAGHRPDAVLLDVLMPYVDGLDVCRRLRARGDRTPVLLLTARHEIPDRVAGLDAGADDYLTKPFSLDELLARLRSLLRRAAPHDADTIAVADLVVDRAARRASRRERVLDLTKTEFALLDVLVRNTGIVLSRDTLYERVWGWDFEGSSKTLDVYVGYLRRKLEAAGEPRLLHTVRGVGYVVREA